MTATNLETSPNLSLLHELKALWKRKELVFTWTKYLIISQYAETRLGLFWIFIKPLIMAGTYSVAFNLILGVRPPPENVPFICFYLAGITAWQLFNLSTSESTILIASKISIINQIRFPREIIILVNYLVNFVDFLGSFFVLFIILILYGFTPNWNYLFLALPIISISFLTLGVMFLLSAIGVFVRDLPNIVNPILTLLMFFSGVLFSIDVVPAHLKWLLNINPILHYVEMFRDIVVYGKPPSTESSVYLLIFGTLTLIIGYIYFKNKEGVFSDY